jgi:hypothetical protein
MRKLRRRFILWAERTKWARPLWINWMVKRDAKLCAEEFDKQPDAEGYARTLNVHVNPPIR